MVGNVTETKEKEIIVFFQKQIAWRKAKPDKELWLTDLKEMYEVLMPHLSLLESTKEYIHKIIIDAQ